MSSLESISCVVPCLNEHANLGVLLPGLITVLKKMAPRYEIIVVDDGSTDATPELVNRLAAAHPEIVYLQLSRNFGKENALSAGLEAAQGQVVVSMDADLQHPPALIPEMLARWEAGADMVYGVRASRHDESAFKRIGTKLFYQLMRTPGGVRVPENAGDFRLMDRSVVDALLMLPERNRFMKGLFAWVGFKAEPFYYHPPERLHGTSTFKPFKLFGFAIDGLTAFTTWPLRVLSVAGFVISLLAFAFGAFTVIKHLLFGDPVQGFTTLATVILFFAGINLVSVGVLGEYIGRIFGEVKNRPVYIVRKRHGHGLASSGVEPVNEVKRGARES
ncbi:MULTISPECIES: glycosyltransferase family 2 protein [unclassified Pusillimonas]|uniref:glycosyltransferase family 2 protein n=1 Tax=unclassified Pusillimonas TaxID=2640016 RepID=UPI000B9CD7BF|nr:MULTISPECIES: glycosyltransferase family 2 protein [unclassified Pusillimonas]OXR50667.1 glycosyltransferase [Pusillimonas sp. T2]ROT45411.1 glycosyltransferase [Pusillimonas sp. NJUB218]